MRNKGTGESKCNMQIRRKEWCRMGARQTAKTHQNKQRDFYEKNREA